MKPKDNLVICERCGSDACYTSTLKKGLTLHMCYGCGFFTNSKATKQSDFINEQMEVLPELHKDLLFEDEKGKVWIPSTTQTDKGIVFANGTSVEEWKWAACLLEDGKMNMKTLRLFEQNNYMDAIEYIGAFN